MGVASGCGEQEVGVASGSGWNLWVWLVGVVVKRYIHTCRFPHIIIIISFNDNVEVGRPISKTQSS